jgi:hypothetical protein
LLHFRPRVVPERTLKLSYTWGLGDMATVLVLLLLGSGLMLFAAVIFSNFTGYLLPWDQTAYWAITISDRAGTWEFGLQVMNTSSESSSGESGSSSDVDSDTGWGFAAGYNFSNRLAVMFDVNWVRPDYEATRVVAGTCRVTSRRWANAPS